MFNRWKNNTRSASLTVDQEGSKTSLHDYRGASKQELRALISERDGNLAGVHFDRTSFINLLDLQKEGVHFSLRKANLTGIDLSTRLSSEKKSGKEVVFYTRISHLDLSEAIFLDANLSGVLFEKCLLKGTSFRYANLDRCTFARCDITRSIFIGSQSLNPRQIYTSSGRTEAIYDDPSSIMSGLYKIRSESLQRRQDGSLGQRIVKTFKSKSKPLTIYLDTTEATEKTIADELKVKARNNSIYSSLKFSVPHNTSMPTPDTSEKAALVMEESAQQSASDAQQKGDSIARRRRMLDARRRSANISAGSVSSNTSTKHVKDLELRRRSSNSRSVPSRTH